MRSIAAGARAQQRPASYVVIRRTRILTRTRLFVFASRTDSSDYDHADAPLPSRYALEPVSGGGGGPSAGGGRGPRGSLPHVLGPAGGPPALSRHDAHLLSEWTRDQLRQRRDEEERRGRLAIVLSVGLLRVRTSSVTS